MSDEAKPTGLALMRAPFPANQISKLPKPTTKQTDAVKADFNTGIRCQECGQWHHKDVVHLDYVGHAALTDRLLDCDAAWNWEPLAFAPSGLPLIDHNGGTWIKLTVCGVTRLGYGHPDGKTGGNAVKELIGDALRNAAMRFGAALDLWHKGDLHGDDADDVASRPTPPAEQQPPRQPSAVDVACESMGNADRIDMLKAIWDGLPKSVQGERRVKQAANAAKRALTPPADDLNDEIPY
jgi:hypothetical protein